MTLSPLIDDHSGTKHSRWFVTSNAAARDATLDSKPRVVPILSPTVQPASAPLRLRLRLATNQLPRPHRANLLHSHNAAKSP